MCKERYEAAGLSLVNPIEFPMLLDGLGGVFILHKNILVVTYEG